jgi:hypothetical protein
LLDSGTISSKFPRYQEERQKWESLREWICKTRRERERERERLTVNHEPKWWCISVEGIKMEDLLQFNPSITNQCDIFGNCTTMRSKRLSSEKSVIQCVLNISNDCRANQFLKQRKVESCKRCKNILRKTQGNEPNIPLIRIYSVFGRFWGNWMNWNLNI